jgi:hypothetical protein
MKASVRALLIAALSVVAQLDRCAGCGVVPERLRDAPTPAVLARPLVCAS